MLIYWKSYWFVIPQHVHGYLIFVRIRQRFALQGVLSQMLVLLQPRLYMCWQKLFWCFIPAMNNRRFCYGHSKIVLTE